MLLSYWITRFTLGSRFLNVSTIDYHFLGSFGLITALFPFGVGSDFLGDDIVAI